MLSSLRHAPRRHCLKSHAKQSCFHWLHFFQAKTLRWRCCPLFRQRPTFQDRLFFFRDRWSRSPAGPAGKETESKRKITQEELVKRDTPPGALRNSIAGEPEVPVLRACVRCGVLGQDVPSPRLCRSCVRPGLCILSAMHVSNRTSSSGVRSVTRLLRQ